MSKEHPDLDETIAVAATDATVAGAGVRSGSGSGSATADDLTVAVSDETIVVNFADAGDETIVANVAALGDETIVVPSAANSDDDATLVASSASMSAELPVDTGIEAAQQSPELAGSASKRSRVRSAAQSESSSPASPVDGPVSNRRMSALFGRGAGLDPQRPIAPAPGTTPWDTPITGTRGVAQGIPVSYGARAHAEADVLMGIDEVQRKIGAAPQPHPVFIREGRDQLPSLQRLDQRRRAVTLAIYGGVTAACVLGLWGVATIAFGW